MGFEALKKADKGEAVEAKITVGCPIMLCLPTEI